MKKRKIQSGMPRRGQIKKEIIHSLITKTILATGVSVLTFLYSKGWTLIYTDISFLGYVYFVFSLFLVLFLHDTYFYWTHRLLHTSWLYRKVHIVHHSSSSPTPFTSFSFHPIEAIIQAVFLHIIIFILPLHWTILIIFPAISFFMNIIGHLGYEIYPKKLIHHPFFKFINTPTHHNLHHKYHKGNLSFYVNIWDRLMSTDREDYDKTFDKLHE